MLQRLLQNWGGRHLLYQISYLLPFWKVLTSCAVSCFECSPIGIRPRVKWVKESWRTEGVCFCENWKTANKRRWFGQLPVLQIISTRLVRCCCCVDIIWNRRKRTESKLETWLSGRCFAIPEKEFTRGYIYTEWLRDYIYTKWLTRDNIPSDWRDAAWLKYLWQFTEWLTNIAIFNLVPSNWSPHKHCHIYPICSAMCWRTDSLKLF